MKKMTNWVLAATLVIICGASVLTSCSNDNAPAGGRTPSLSESAMTCGLAAT